jgi:hypothetical protein
VSDTYPRYLRAAKRKHADPEAIIEAAKADLSIRQQAQLVSVSVERHGYRLPKARRDPLIDALLEDGLGPQRISDLLGCAPRTVARRQPAQVGSANGLDKRPERDKTASRDQPPILSFSAAGGGSDVRLIQRVLRGGGR